jgi:hypothetical protein
MRRLPTVLLLVVLGLMSTAPAVAAMTPRVNVDLSVDATDCGALVLTADVDWKGIRISATGYMIEWFAVTSFSYTLGTSAFDPGRRADKTHGSLTVSFTRNGYFDTSIYPGATYSALLRVVGTGQVVGSSNRVPIPNCV